MGMAERVSKGKINCISCGRPGMTEWKGIMVTRGRRSLKWLELMQDLRPKGREALSLFPTLLPATVEGQGLPCHLGGSELLGLGGLSSHRNTASHPFYILGLSPWLELRPLSRG